MPDYHHIILHSFTPSLPQKRSYCLYTQLSGQIEQHKRHTIFFMQVLQRQVQWVSHRKESKSLTRALETAVFEKDVDSIMVAIEAINIKVEERNRRSTSPTCENVPPFCSKKDFCVFMGYTSKIIFGSIIRVSSVSFFSLNSYKPLALRSSSAHYLPNHDGRSDGRTDNGNLIQDQKKAPGKWTDDFLPTSVVVGSTQLFASAVYDTG